MSVSYTSQKCPSCGSTKFKYLKDIKMWECAYCGTNIERHEEADSLFTIKNVVRQTLIDVSYRRFNEANNNLIECEKIDARYVGTIIAKICFLLNSALYNGITQQEKQNNINQIKKYYNILCENNNKPSEEEYVLYEFLDSAEAYGLLILVYDTLNAKERVELVSKFFNPEEVYSLELNSSLLKYMVNHNNLETADKIVANIDNIEKKSALLFLLNNYPDGEQKAINCNLIINQNILNYDESHIIEDYLVNSGDDINTKFEITCASLKSDARPSIKSVMDYVVSKISETEKIERIFDMIMSKKLVDTEIYTIVEYSLEKCPQETILYIFETLKKSNQFVVLNQQHFISLFNNKAVDNEYKKRITNLAIEFNVNNKTKEQFVSYYLNNITDEKTEREIFLEYLFTLVSSLSTNSIENYILNCALDGDNKPKIVKRIFQLDVNKSFFRETFDKYISTGADSALVTDKIIDILSDNGLKLSENALTAFLLNPYCAEEKKLNVLRKSINSNVRYLGLLDKYMSGITNNAFSGNIFQTLLDYTDSISADACIKYLLYISDTQTSKANSARNLVEKCKIPVITKETNIVFNNDSVYCNVLQAYVLLTPDSPEITVTVVDLIGGKNIKANTEIIYSGTKKKFKKYLSLVKNSLNPSSLAAAGELNLL